MAESVSCGSTVSELAPKRAAKQADTRKPATLVELLDWAYVKQRVRDARRHEAASGPIASSWSTTGLVCRDLTAGAVIRAQGGAYVPVAHPDAHTVDDFVMRLQAGERALVLQYAATQSMPDWAPSLPALVVVPVMSAGRPKVKLNSRRHPELCFIEYKGFPEARAAAIGAHARRTYEAWHAALRVLWGALQIEDCLKSWRVTGVGAERTPWQARTYPQGEQPSCACDESLT